MTTYFKGIDNYGTTYSLYSYTTENGNTYYAFSLVNKPYEIDTHIDCDTLDEAKAELMAYFKNCTFKTA